VFPVDEQVKKFSQPATGSPGSAAFALDEVKLLHQAQGIQSCAQSRKVDVPGTWYD
jgi:hypothetical protein